MLGTAPETYAYITYGATSNMYTKSSRKKSSHEFLYCLLIYTTLRKAPQNEWICQRGQHGRHQHAADHDSLSDCVGAELCSCAHRKCKCVLPFKQKFKNTFNHIT